MAFVDLFLLLFVALVVIIVQLRFYYEYYVTVACTAPAMFYYAICRVIGCLFGLHSKSM